MKNEMGLKGIRKVKEEDEPGMQLQDRFKAG